MTTIDSDTYSTTAPLFKGVWLHAPADIAATERHFLYGNIGRAEDLSVERSIVPLVGRARPVAEYGEADSLSLGLSVTVPHGLTHDEGVQWWRDQVRARRTLLYRDNRSRLVFVSLGKVTITDSKEGSVIACSVTEVDFSEAI